MSSRTRSLIAAVAVGGLLPLTVVATAAADTESCAPLTVPGAEHQRTACLAGLTTASTAASGHTNPEDYAGLSAADTPVPQGVPGVQVDGYFPDDSTGNTNNGWNHDAQFVIRLPEQWNGKLVVTGAPGNRRQYANDKAIADQVLAKGYAFASTDKGNVGTAFYRGQRYPGQSMMEWHQRMTQLTVAAKQVVRKHYGRSARTTLAAGLSNGGYLVRWQLENRPWLYDGGVDWEGTLWTDRGPNPLTFLPPALKHYPAFAAGDQKAGKAIRKAGFSRETEFLWDFHHRVYWDLTQRIYRETLDPTFDGELDAGVPYCKSGTPNCDADYDFAKRPQAKAAMRMIGLTGRIGKPMITVHGTLDTLLPIGADSDYYAKMIRRNGRGWLHDYRRIANGNHTDGLVDVYPDRLVALAPHFVRALDDLARRVG